MSSCSGSGSGVEIAMMRGVAWPLLLLLLVTSIEASSSSALAAGRLKVSGLSVDDDSSWLQLSSGKRKRPEQEEPLTFFEVANPIPVPRFKPCSLVLLRHSFGNTINSPPVVAPYLADNACAAAAHEWERVVLRWRGSCKGRQFDRISAVWLSGVEIFRTCTAEPTKRGIVWEIEKDITKYSALLRQNQSLVVSLGNVIDKTYTGIINLTLVADFYPATSSSNSASSSNADLILPVALPSPQKGGYWFQLQNETDVGSVSLQLPKNIYRATLEVCVSFHGNDEFWYSNPSNDYLQANNITGTPGNGPYREVVALLDGKVVGEICPLPVVYTGGVNPLFWRPAAAIGAFNLPTYTLDVTPFVGSLVDGKRHKFSLRVTNALNFWLLDANLHLWLDQHSRATSGGLLEHSAPSAKAKSDSRFKGLDGVLKSTAARSLSYSGYVRSSHGSLTSSSSYSYRFSNTMTFSGNGSVNIVQQDIESKSRFVVKTEYEDISLQQTSASYPFYMYSKQVEGKNNSVVLDASISHGIKQETQAYSAAAPDPEAGYFSSLDNTQDTDGRIVIQGSTVTSGVGELKQSYVFESTDECYYRKLKTRNYTTLYDDSGRRCIASS